MQIHTNHLHQEENSPVNQTLTGVYENDWGVLDYMTSVMFQEFDDGKL